MIEIRREQERDLSQVYGVNVAAFGRDAEAGLVDRLRKIEGYLAYVAHLNERVVGHISFSPVTLDGTQCQFVGLAPMSVLPEFQRQGIGSLLVYRGVEGCRSGGCSAIFVMGHPRYYSKFGFQVANRYGFECEYKVKAENFMVLELQARAFEGKGGLIKYDPVFRGI